MENGLWAIADGLLAKVIIGLIGAASGIFGGWFVSRANIMAAVDKRVNSLIGHLQSEITRLTVRCEAAEGKCDVAEESHRACEGRLDALEQDKRELTRRLDALMAEPIASYGQRPPKD